MIRPVLLTVDDDPQVLGTITRDLRRHYGSEYRIVIAGAGDEALPALDELEGRKEPVALLADTDVAISAINRSQVDYYLLKPWDPPEEGFPSGLSGADLACVGTEPPTEWLEGVLALHFIHRVPAGL